jgi:hypothetical protein
MHAARKSSGGPAPFIISTLLFKLKHSLRTRQANPGQADALPSSISRSVEALSEILNIGDDR